MTGFLLGWGFFGCLGIWGAWPSVREEIGSGSIVFVAVARRSSIDKYFSKKKDTISAKLLNIVSSNTDLWWSLWCKLSLKVGMHQIRSKVFINGKLRMLLPCAEGAIADSEFGIIWKVKGNELEMRHYFYGGCLKKWLFVHDQLHLLHFSAKIIEENAPENTTQIEGETLVDMKR